MDGCGCVGGGCVASRGSAVEGVLAHAPREGGDGISRVPAIRAQGGGGRASRPGVECEGGGSQLWQRRNPLRPLSAHNLLLNSDRLEDHDAWRIMSVDDVRNGALVAGWDSDTLRLADLAARELSGNPLAVLIDRFSPHTLDLWIGALASAGRIIERQGNQSSAAGEASLPNLEEVRLAAVGS